MHCVGVESPGLLEDTNSIPDKRCSVIVRGKDTSGHACLLLTCFAIVRGDQMAIEDMGAIHQSVYEVCCSVQ